MKILAIDPATTCGWSYLENGKFTAGVWFLGNNRKLHQGHLFVSMHARLRVHAVINGNPDEVVYERPGILQGEAKKVLPGLQAIIEFWAIQNAVTIHAYSSGEIKKHATGNGNADKEMMVAAAKEKWPNIEIETHDQADAMHLLSYHMMMRNWPKEPKSKKKRKKKSNA